MNQTLSAAPATQRIKALADETRLGIIAHLGAGTCCVCELTEALDIAQPLLSFHLKVLREAGLISDRREGRWTYYTLDREALKELGDLIGDLARPRKVERKPRTCAVKRPSCP